MAKIAMIQNRNGAVRRNQENRVSGELVEVQKLAYQFFVERGFEHGHDQEDWLRAEAAVKNRKRS